MMTTSVLTPQQLELLPEENEIYQELIAVARHSSQMEFFTPRLGLSHADHQRPHDLEGRGNKAEWPVLKGLSLQWRVPRLSEPEFNAYILPSIMLHRQYQDHHIYTNNGHRDPLANNDLLRFHALDTTIALLEPRPYNGNSHTYEQIAGMIKKGRILDQKIPEYKLPFLMEILERIQALPQPDVEAIQSPFFIPNIGIPEYVHEKIVKKISQATTDALEKIG